MVPDISCDSFWSCGDEASVTSHPMNKHSWFGLITEAVKTCLEVFFNGICGLAVHITLVVGGGKTCNSSFIQEHEITDKQMQILTQNIYVHICRAAFIIVTLDICQSFSLLIS